MKVILMAVIMIVYLLGGLYLIGKMDKAIKETIYKTYGVPNEGK